MSVPSTENIYLTEFGPKRSKFPPPRYFLQKRDLTTGEPILVPIEGDVVVDRHKLHPDNETHMKELIDVVAKMNRDIAQLKGLTTKESAQDWITRTGKKNWKVEGQDLDDNPTTPDNIVVYDADGNKRYIDGYYTTDPKKRAFFKDYYTAYSNPDSRDEKKQRDYAYEKGYKKHAPSSPYREFLKLVNARLKQFFAEHQIAKKQRQKLKELGQLTSYLWRIKYFPEYIKREDSRLANYTDKDFEEQDVVKRNKAAVRKIWEKYADTIKGEISTMPDNNFSTLYNAWNKYKAGAFQGKTMELEPVSVSSQ
jgi:hypothetical protein